MFACIVAMQYLEYRLADECSIRVDLFDCSIREYLNIWCYGDFTPDDAKEFGYKSNEIRIATAYLLTYCVYGCTICTVFISQCVGGSKKLQG